MVLVARLPISMNKQRGLNTILHGESSIRVTKRYVQAPSCLSHVVVPVAGGALGAT